jgi:hypothetical protein
MTTETAVPMQPMQPVQTEQPKRILGGDILTWDYEQLADAFDELRKKLSKKKYPVKVSQETIAFLHDEIIQNVVWTGQQAWDIKEAVELIGELVPDKTVKASKESIRSLFQIIINHKYTGVKYMHIVAETCNKLVTAIQLMNQDDQDLRDAGFELQAAEQGITPESAMKLAVDSTPKSK